MFAVSRSFTKFSTHPRFFELFDQILGDSYRLKVHRYYETYGRHHMAWHTDNRSYASIPGLIVLAYMSEVDDGEFQYIRGSHRWPRGETGSYTDHFVAKNFQNDLLSFNGPKGTLIIFDICGFHRAKPVKRGKFVRKNLLFQVDATLDYSEPVLINPEYIENLDDRTKRYLGFNQPSGLPLYPATDLSSMPLRRQADILIRGLGKKIAKAPREMLPRRIKSAVKNFRLTTS